MSAASTTTGAKCPACGAMERGAFCSQCGTCINAGHCTGCGNALHAGARFCGTCGTTVAGARAITARPPAPGAATLRGTAPVNRVPWAVAAALITLIIGYLAFTNVKPGPTAESVPTPDGAPFADQGGTAGTAPDISNMSPREQAGRLYDRIMRYAEEGRTDSLAFFAPMAMTTFETLGADLDLDARYDYGRVASETGHLDVAAAQADTILSQAPTHLLGLALRARTAVKRKDARAAKAAWSAFLAAKDAELAKRLPEYQAHSNDITTATKLAQAVK